MIFNAKINCLLIQSSQWPPLMPTPWTSYSKDGILVISPPDTSPHSQSDLSVSALWHPMSPLMVAFSTCHFQNHVIKMWLFVLPIDISLPSPSGADSMDSYIRELPLGPDLSTCRPAQWPPLTPTPCGPSTPRMALSSSCLPAHDLTAN